MENKFDVGKITVNIKLDSTKLLNDIFMLEKEKIINLFTRENKEICVRTEVDFYVFSINDYIIIG